MNILYLTSEAAPFIASGGLGDVMGALPKYVAASGADKVSVILPCYGQIKQSYKNNFSRVCDICFNLSWRETGATVYKSEYCGVDYYFVENHYYFDRKSIYGEYDDAERFAFFSIAALEFIKQYGLMVDVLNANDWQTASAVIYLKTLYKEDSVLSGIKTVYTIHNIEYQGKFDPYILGDVFGLDVMHLGDLTFDGCLNLMKGAIVLSDYITTVSPNYANELQYDFFAFGLQDIIKSCAGKMCGVINGIDYSVFSPEHDPDIYKSYSARFVKSGKAKNKLMICEELGLDTDPSIPLVVMITRLASQKGIDLLLYIADELLSQRVQLIVLGTGEKEYENSLCALEKKHNNLRALIKFDRALSKKLYAAADIFLMPSKSEPCGLAQMIACSYGAVPLVRAVGGLEDTIVGYPESNSNGFKFYNYNAHEMLDAITSALSLYQNERKWAELRRRAKNTVFGWDKSAADYIAIYNKLTH